jgi:putative phage-type endonuclease
MDEGQVKQGTAEWHAARKGFVTSSAVHKLMTKPKLKADIDAGNLSVGAKTYVLDMIAAEVSMPVEVNVESTTWGTNYESLAKHFYTQRTGNIVEDAGFIVSDIEGYGGSPDGIVKAGNGIVEFKCPFNPTNHLKHCLIESAEDLPDEYYWQCVSNMRVCKADWCDFVSFDPRIDDEIGLFIFRLLRDSEIGNEERMVLKVKKALEYKVKLKKKLLMPKM